MPSPSQLARFEIYPAMQLGGSPANLVDQAREGVADIVWTAPGYTPERFPQSEVFELPFLTAGAEVTARAAWRFFERHVQEEFAEVHPLAFHVHGPGHLHMRAPAVESIDDLAGRRVRVRPA